MKRYLRGIGLGILALSIMATGKVAYAAAAAEYAMLLSITAIGVSATGEKTSSGLRINSAKDDATGMTNYSLSFINPTLPEDAEEVELMYRYRDPKSGKEYVVKTGLVEYCKPQKANDAIEVLCTIGGGVNTSTSSSGTSATTTTTTNLAR